MKKMEKLVPVAVAGLVLAGAGTLDARAEEANLPILPQEGDQPILEQQQESNLLDTDIKEVVPSPQPDEGEEGNPEDTENPGDVEDGDQEETENSNTSQVIVNPSVDADGTVTGDGTLDITTTPDPDATEVDHIPGNPLPPVPTENEDGSTTITITTPTTDVTTEKSETEISGTVTGEPDNSQPTEEEQEPVKDALSEALEAIKNKGENDEWDGTYDWDKLDKVGGFDATHAAGETEGTHTITLTQEELNDKPLTTEELGKVLGVELTENTAEDGSTYYTYTDANGAAVTVRKTDSSTETKTTTWVITLTETTKTENGDGSAEIKIPDEQPPLVDAPNQAEGSLSVKDVLDKVDGDTFDGKEATITKDDDGNITKIESGSKTYEFTYIPGENPITVKDLSIAEIFALLPQGEGSPYTMDADGIYFNGHKLTFDETTGVYTPVTVKMTMTDTQAGTKDHDTSTDKTDAEVEAELKKNAVIEAAKQAIGDAMTVEQITAQYEQDTDGNDEWTFTVTDQDGKKHLYTVKATGKVEKGELVVEHLSEEDQKNLTGENNSTTTITGSAYVSGETITWSGTENETTSKFITVDKNTGVATVGAVKDQVIDEATGEVVVSVSEDGKTIITQFSVTNNGLEMITEKKYTFTTGLAPTAEDMADFLNKQGAQFNEVTGLSKISWEVETSIWTRTPNTGNDVTTDHFGENGSGQQVSDSQGEIPAEKQTDGSYKYGDFTLTKDEKASTDTKTVYTYEDKTNNKVYTIEEEKVALSDAEIVTLIKQQDQTIPEGANVTIDRNAGTASYKDGDKTITFTFDANSLNKTTVKMTVTESKNFTNSVGENASEAEREAARGEVAEAAANWLYQQMNQPGIDSSMVEILTNLGITEGMQPGDIKEILLENPLITQGAPDFSKFGEDDIKAYLTQISEGKKAQSSQLGNHMDLDLVNKVDRPDGTMEDCYLIHGQWTIQASDSMDKIASGTGTDISSKFNNVLTWDGSNTALGAQGKGYWEYAHTNQNSNIFKNYKYYSITGKVAHGTAADSVAGYNSASQATQAAEQKAGEGKDYAAYVIKKVETGSGKKKQTSYTVEYFTKDQLADITVYGFFDAAGNTCNMGGYDLALSGLKLTEAGTILVEGAGRVTYSTQLSTRTTLGEVMNQSLTLLNKQTSTPKTGYTDSEKVITHNNGQQLNGAWTITQTKTEADLKKTDGSGEWLYSESGSSSYDVYQTYTQGTGSGEASFNKLIDDLKLGYTYTYEVPGAPDIVIDSRNIQSVRNVNVVLDNTTVTTTPGAPIEDTNTTPAPVTPTPDVDEDDDDPTPPVIIDEDDVPLTETPETPEIPDVEIPDEEVPMVETPDVELPDEDVPLAEIADEEVPLAAVPQTNDSFLLEALALLTSGVSGLWLGLNKKRKF